jgi:hypothetical protein
VGCSYIYAMHAHSCLPVSRIYMHAMNTAVIARERSAELACMPAQVFFPAQSYVVALFMIDHER